MFNKELENLEYKYCAEYLRKIIFNLAKADDAKLQEQFLDEIREKISEIDKEINYILCKSFIKYCMKKKLNPYVVLYPLSPNELKLESAEINRTNQITEISSNYDFIKIVHGGTADTIIYQRKYEKLLDWGEAKLKYMGKSDRQAYISLEGAASLIRGLTVSIDHDNHIKSLHPMDIA